MTQSSQTEAALPDYLVLRASEIEPFERGSGVKTVPYVGKWNNDRNASTTGTTSFPPGMAIPLHTHNVEEQVLILEGEATCEIDGKLFELVAGDFTWVPAGTPHRFINRGLTRMTILWIYGGYHVTRTIVATGETFEHLSEKDRGATKA
ncbi:MAG: cupin domain-containing protein [Chloroflexi bacterium]|nr:cupin domain-containing protein [Chloroflexota bacterium]